MLAGAVAAATFALGSLIVGALAQHREVRLSLRKIILVLGTGTLLVAASFPAYVALSDARGLWRTQFLSGIGFGIAAAALLILGASLVGRYRASVIAVAVAGSFVAYAGGSTAYRAANYHHDVWVRHRDAIAQVLDGRTPRRARGP